MRPSRLLFSLLALAAFAAGAQDPAPRPIVPHPTLAGQTIIVLPFENASRAPGLEWIGESFPEILGQRLASSTSLYVIGRDDRLYAFDRLGIAANVRPSRATLIRIAEQMDVDFVILGRFTYDGQTFTATAQLLDMKRLHLSPSVVQSGPLPRLLDIQTALAWDLLRLMTPDLTMSRNTFVSASAPIRLDALEKYIRGVIAVARADKIRNFRDAVRLNPAYAPALLQLGKVLFFARDYAGATGTLARVPATDPVAREANFYLGLAAFYQGDLARAESAFAFVAARLPLTEVYNNLGVVAGRRGQNAALGYFQRAVQADPSDPDYHFNYAVALYKAGDATAASRQLREALTRRGLDTEAKAFLDAINPAAPPAPAVPPKIAAAPAAPVKVPLERIKRNYDEASFRQLALEIQHLNEQRLVSADPRTHAAAHARRGRELLGHGLPTLAEREFREAILLDPASPAAHAGLARVLEQNHDAAAARAEARAAIRLQPSADAFLVLARLDLADNKPEAAGESVDRALGLEPANAAAQTLKRAIAAKLAEKARPLPDR